MNIPALLFTFQIMATFAMTGLIWFVQVVHYPLFAMIPDPHHLPYASQHQQRTGWVVAPLMLVELVTATLMLWPVCRLGVVGRFEAGAGLVLLVVVWTSTALVQIPIHRELSSGLKQKAVGKLVLTNWIRTVAWSSRSALLASLLWRLL